MRKPFFLAVLLVHCAPAVPPLNNRAEIAPSNRASPPSVANVGNHAERVVGVDGRDGRDGVNMGSLSLAEAQTRMLSLINRDRKTAGLPPVELDLGAPTRAAERHARDMAANAFLGHWGIDGSVPEQRLTESGGVDMVLENALCLVDEKRRAVAKTPRFETAQIDEAQRMFFEELPPHDGHRQNILKPWHTHVGIGLVMVEPGPGEAVFPCVVQEFVDRYGVHAPIPASAPAGSSLRIESTFSAGVRGGAVGLTRLPPQKPITPAEANTRRSYPVPEPQETFWPQGFKTRLPVTLEGQKLSFSLQLGQVPGLYEVSVWAKLPGREDYRIVSLRTVRVQ